VALADGVSIDPNNPVAPDEVLHRLVKPDYVDPINGGWRISSQAFLGGRERRISVNRTLLCGDDPTYTQEQPTDFVCWLLTGEVQNLTVTRNAPDGTVERYGVRVDPTPLPHNNAHADIYVASSPASSAPFRKLKEKVAEIAEFVEGFAPPPRED
jgi:hypothetical protein